MEIILLLIGGFFYFIPTFLSGHKRNRGAIFALNLLLGWSIIGWIVALVWALSNDAPAQRVVVQQAPKPDNDTAAYAKLRDLRDRGVISQEAFLEEVGKL